MGEGVDERDPIVKTLRVVVMAAFGSRYPVLDTLLPAVTSSGVCSGVEQQQ